MPRKLPLLLYDYESYRWALEQALAFLEGQEGMRLVLAALESGDDGFLRLASWLMDGDAPFPKLHDSALLTEAAILGCWEAGEALSQRLQREKKYPIDWNKTSAAVPVEDTDAVDAAGRESHLEVVRFFHGECGVPMPATWRLAHATASTSVEYIQYVLETVPEANIDDRRLLQNAVECASQRVIEYLVHNCGLWCPSIFDIAAHRGFDARSSGSFEISRFLYAHARVRASHLGTSLVTQINFDKIGIIKLATSGRFARVRWLVECVSEADMGKPFATGNFNKHLYPSSDAQAVILACLRVRPEQHRSPAWLPAWVVAANCFEACAMLVNMGHPNVGDPSVYRSITDMLRDARFILVAAGVEHCSSYLVNEIIAWAAKVGAIPVLSSLGDALAPGRIHLAIVNAVRYGHVDVLEWLHRDKQSLLLPAYACEDSRISVEKLVGEAARYITLSVSSGSSRRWTCPYTSSPMCSSTL